MSSKPERVRDLGDADHAAADDRDLAAVLLRQIENLLDAVDRRAEAGDDQPPLRRLKISSMRGRTARSLLGVARAGRTLVESESSSRTPRLP